MISLFPHAFATGEFLRHKYEHMNIHSLAFVHRLVNTSCRERAVERASTLMVVRQSSLIFLVMNFDIDIVTGPFQNARTHASYQHPRTRQRPPITLCDELVQARAQPRAFSPVFSKYCPSSSRFTALWSVISWLRFGSPCATPSHPAKRLRLAPCNHQAYSVLLDPLCRVHH